MDRKAKQGETMTRSVIKSRRLSHPLRRRKRLFLAGACILICFLIGAVIAGPLLHLDTLFGPKATVTLTPGVQPEQADYRLTAVTSIPDLNSNQIPAHPLSASSLTQTVSGGVSTSQPSTPATGVLTFVNTTTSPQTIQSGTVIGKDGVAVSFTGPFTVGVSQETTTRTGTAVNPGSGGNIDAFDIDTPCCGIDGIIVKNETPFSGGKEAVPGIVQQSDVDQAAQTSIKALTPNAQENLMRMAIKSTERVANGPQQCQPHTSVNPLVGQRAITITLTVSVTCSELVYDAQAAQTLASSLLIKRVHDDPKLGNAYTLQGLIAFLVQRSAVTSAGQQAELDVQVRGLWVHTLSPALQNQFARQIAGKKEAEAKKILLRYAWIHDVHFSSPGDLPQNAAAILFVEGMPEATLSTGFARRHPSHLAPNSIVRGSHY